MAPLIKRQADLDRLLSHPLGVPVTDGHGGAPREAPRPRDHAQDVRLVPADPRALRARSGVMSLEHAVHQMTQVPAARVADRGPRRARRRSRGRPAAVRPGNVANRATEKGDVAARPAGIIAGDGERALGRRRWSGHRRSTGKRPVAAMGIDVAIVNGLIVDGTGGAAVPGHGARRGRPAAGPSRRGRPRPSSAPRRWSTRAGWRSRRASSTCTRIRTFEPVGAARDQRDRAGRHHPGRRPVRVLGRTRQPREPRHDDRGRAGLRLPRRALGLDVDRRLPGVGRADRRRHQHRDAPRAQHAAPRGDGR